MPKDISGKNNPFYGKKHSEESKRKMGGAVKDYNGNKNPFYGKKHKQESIDRTKEKLSKIFAGDGNPFYGKTHSPESIQKMIEANRSFRLLNKDKILHDRLNRMGITRDKIEAAFLEYCNTCKNANDIQNDLNLDKRVFFKYVEQFGIASAEQIQEVKLSKKMGRAKSSPEERFYKMFCERYGEQNVIWSYKINSYFYDFFLFKSILIEYDGYYWHSILKSKNDENKDILAKNLDIPLYRIKEDEKRRCNFELEMQKIDEVINEFQINRDKIKDI